MLRISILKQMRFELEPTMPIKNDMNLQLGWKKLLSGCDVQREIAEGTLAGAC